ncbi:MAG: RsmG family class I SAM-dependent methyltransferase [Gaiellaceae bacterium]
MPARVPSATELTDVRLRGWLEALIATPGLTAVRNLDEARALHVDGALLASPWLKAGSVVDVGSGGGSPGIPLAATRPDLEVTLLEATGKKVAFLRRWAKEFDNVAVEHARAEELAKAAGREAFDFAVARALAPPAVALEWALPLVRRGGRFVLYTTRPHRDLVAQIAPLLGGQLIDAADAAGSDRMLCIVEKSAETPARFPRRVGIARKRPLQPPRN